MLSCPLGPDGCSSVLLKPKSFSLVLREEITPALRLLTPAHLRKHLFISDTQEHVHIFPP